MSETMSAFGAYQTYLAMQQHFTRKTYDFFKYNGKVKASESAFLGRKDRYFFEKAAKKFKRDDFRDFLLANYIASDDHWIGNLMSEGNLIKYKKWKKNVDSLSYNFKEELDKMWEMEDNFNMVFKQIDGKQPLLFRLFLRQKISLETIVVLDDLVGFSKLWLKYDDMMLNDFVFKLNKYKPFLHNAVLVDKSKYKKIILDIYG